MEYYVYAVCFGVGLLFAIVSAFLGHLFGGHDVHVDVGTGGHAEAGFQDTGHAGPLTVQPDHHHCLYHCIRRLGVDLLQD